LTGFAGIEPRSGGATNDYQLIVTFSTPLTATPQAQVSAGVGQIGSNGTANGNVTVNGSTVTIPLTNVGNAQTLRVTLFGVTNTSGTSTVTIPINILIGDTSVNGSVTASDLGQAKAETGQPITLANFRADVNANGSITASDIAMVKSQTGTSLPPAANP